MTSARRAILLALPVVVAACAPLGAAERAAYDALHRTWGGLTERTVEAGGVTFSVAEGGAGPAVLLLHGFSASKETWYPFARHLVDDHRVIIPDVPPFGAGTRDGIGCGVEEHVARTLALLDALEVDRAHVVGNSMGGFIAALLAARHPERVASVTLIDAAGVDMPRPSRGMRALERGENLFLIDDGDDADAFFDIIFVDAPPITPSIKADFVQSEHARRADLARWFAELQDEYVPLEPLLPSVAAPALVVWGREDQVLDVSMVDAFAAGLPRAEIHILDGRGHCPQIEDPQGVAALVRAFLAETSGAAGAGAR